MTIEPRSLVPKLNWGIFPGRKLLIAPLSDASPPAASTKFRLASYHSVRPAPLELSVTPMTTRCLPSAPTISRSRAMTLPVFSMPTPSRPLTETIQAGMPLAFRISIAGEPPFLSDAAQEDIGPAIFAHDRQLTGT